jgi:hypothetical protein
MTEDSDYIGPGRDAPAFEPSRMTPPNKIAFVIDATVVDVLHTDDRLAAIFLSEPKVIDVTEHYENNPNLNMSGWLYDGQNFLDITNREESVPLAQDNQ